jgi:hypothetical protein
MNKPEDLRQELSTEQQLARLVETLGLPDAVWQECKNSIEQIEVIDSDIGEEYYDFESDRSIKFLEQLSVIVFDAVKNIANTQAAVIQQVILTYAYNKTGRRGIASSAADTIISIAEQEADPDLVAQYQYILYELKRMGVVNTKLDRDSLIQGFITNIERVLIRLRIPLGQKNAASSLDIQGIVPRSPELLEQIPELEAEYIRILYKILPQDSYYLREVGNSHWVLEKIAPD